MNNNNNFDTLVNDIQTEISQLQNKWAAVTEYCSELQQQQRDVQEELASVELEEKLLTRKLQELVGPSEYPELFGDVTSNDKNNNNNNKNQNRHHHDDPTRMLTSKERRIVSNIVFLEDDEENNTNTNNSNSTKRGEKRSAEVQAQLLSSEQELAHDFVFGTEDKKNSSSSLRTKLRSVENVGAVDYSRTILQRILDEQQDALEVSNVLQKQKEILTSKMHQCGAVSVALEAMLLYRAPPNGSY